MTVRAGGPGARAANGALGRRDLLLFAAVAGAAGWKPARARGRTPRIGFVRAGSRQAEARLLAAFRGSLGALGWVDGRNVVILDRWGEGDAGRLPEMVDGLNWSTIDALVTDAAPAAVAAAKVTRTIPIVLAGVPDAVALGLADSLARPGGNVTGLSPSTFDLAGRQLQLLRAAAPAMRHLAAIANFELGGADQRWLSIQTRCERLGLQLLELQTTTPGAVDRAFELARNEGCDGLWVAFDREAAGERAEVVRLAADNRLPAVYPARGFVELGGLMSYGPDPVDLFRHAALYVDKILGGAHPADLPIAAPVTYHLAVNRAAARSLGLTIPPAVLARADEIIDNEVAQPPAPPPMPPPHREGPEAKSASIGGG
ncbi:MAG TPA: ABC transporter substrate-binding protein [Stellaceae bacterium]|nr:ABC transporter substrate-binding protein [Stellaceae bacterium]